MGFQFRKSLMIAQGDCIGAGMKSPSTSVEPKDSKGGRHHRIENYCKLPGTGLSNMSKLSGKRRGGHSSKSARKGSGIIGGLIILFVAVGVIYMLVKVF